MDCQNSLTQTTQHQQFNDYFPESRISYDIFKHILSFNFDNSAIKNILVSKSWMQVIGDIFKEKTLNPIKTQILNLHQKHPLIPALDLYETIIQHQKDLSIKAVLNNIPDYNYQFSYKLSKFETPLIEKIAKDKLINKKQIEFIEQLIKIKRAKTSFDLISDKYQYSNKINALAMLFINLIKNKTSLYSILSLIDENIRILKFSVESVDQLHAIILKELFSSKSNINKDYIFEFSKIIRPDNPFYSEELKYLVSELDASLKIEKNQLEEAVQVLETIKQDSKPKCQLLNKISIAYLKLNHREKALEIIQKIPKSENEILKHFTIHEILYLIKNSDLETAKSRFETLNSMKEKIAFVEKIVEKSIRLKKIDSCLILIRFLDNLESRIPLVSKLLPLILIDNSVEKTLETLLEVTENLSAVEELKENIVFELIKLKRIDEAFQLVNTIQLKKATFFCHLLYENDYPLLALNYLHLIKDPYERNLLFKELINPLDRIDKLDDLTSIIKNLSDDISCSNLYHQLVFIFLKKGNSPKAFTLLKEIPVFDIRNRTISNVIQTLKNEGRLDDLEALQNKLLEIQPEHQECKKRLQEAIRYILTRQAK